MVLKLELTYALAIVALLCAIHGCFPRCRFQIRCTFLNHGVRDGSAQLIGPTAALEDRLVSCTWLTDGDLGIGLYIRYNSQLLATFVD